MIQVKLRDFVRQFSKYSKQDVEVLGKNDKIMGYWTLSDKNKKVSDKKEIADKIVEEVMDQNWSKDLDRKKVSEFSLSKDSTDNADGTIPVTPRIAKQMQEIERSLDEIIPDEIVGTCDICSNPSKELWEHEEEGIERQICKNCFSQRFDATEKLDKFLATKKKVNGIMTSISDGTRTFRTYTKPAAKFTDFNPIPKPVKKEKK